MFTNSITSLHVSKLYIYRSTVPVPSPLSSVTIRVSVCKEVLGMIYCRCSHTCICTRRACRIHRRYPAVWGKCKSLGCIYGSSQTLPCRHIFSEVCLVPLAAARWRTHRDTTLGNSRSSDICLRPAGRKEKIHSVCNIMLLSKWSSYRSKACKSYKSFLSLVELVETRKIL